jgi:hypothetical protein
MPVISNLEFHGQLIVLSIVRDMVYYSYGEKVCPKEGKLLDHQPLRLNKDDFARVKIILV